MQFTHQFFRFYTGTFLIMHTSYEGLTRNIFEKCYVSKLKLLRVTYSFHHLEKFWIGHIYALAILDNGFPFGGQAGDGLR